MKDGDRVLLGTFGVDSGQVMIGDPCYLNEYQANDFEDNRVYLRTKVVAKTKPLLQFKKDFQMYTDIIPEWNKSMNDLIAEGLYERVKPTIDNSFSYNGACNQTLYNKELQGGTLANGLAVVSSTGLGDGEYEVYATYKDAGSFGVRIQKLEIEFFESDDQKLLLG